MPSLNVLITAASRRVPLIRAFQRALRELGVRGKVIVTDTNALSPGVHEADRAFLVPMATDKGYLSALESICRGERVRLLVPTIDDELPLLGSAVKRFEKLGTRVAASDKRTAHICNDKLLTCHYLASHGIPVAPAFLPGAEPRDLPFPVVVKPRVGRGSVGVFTARTARELDFFASYVERPVIQTFLDGPEYTIDVLSDFAGRVLSVVPRERIVIRSGTSDRGRTVDDPGLIDLAVGCARALKLVGPANVQCRVVEGRPVVFEINPRFSGGIPLTIAAGADFPKLLLELTLGREVAPTIGEFTPDLWMTNFETAIMLDGGVADTLQPYVERVLREVG